MNTIIEDSKNIYIFFIEQFINYLKTDKQNPYKIHQSVLQGFAY